MAKEPDNRRVTRVEKEVQQTVSNFIIHHLQQELPGFVTVSRVRMPADLKAAKVYVSLLAAGGNKSEEFGDMSEEEALELAVETLQSSAYEIQNQINKELKLRYCPKLQFYADETTETALRVESLLSKLSEERKRGSE